MAAKLALCQAVARECGVSGGEGVPTTTVSQTGELQRIVRYVEQAYREIEDRHINWRWQRHGFTISTTTGDAIYAFGDATDDDTSSAITTFQRWLVDDDEDPGKIFLTSGGVGTETWLTFATWNDFKSIYRVGTQNNAYPIHVSIDPLNNLVIGPPPNGTYSISGDYQRANQAFDDNDEVPDMPVRFHDLIVYKAMIKYGFFESAQEILGHANYEADRMMDNLENDQLPDIPYGEPMA